MRNKKQKTQTFLGGPFDGLPMSESDREYPLHTFDMPGERRMAVYEINDKGQFVFVKMMPNDNFGEIGGAT